MLKADACFPRAHTGRWSADCEASAAFANMGVVSARSCFGPPLPGPKLRLGLRHRVDLCTQRVPSQVGSGTGLFKTALALGT